MGGRTLLFPAFFCVPFTAALCQELFRHMRPPRAEAASREPVAYNRRVPLAFRGFASAVRGLRHAVTYHYYTSVFLTRHATVLPVGRSCRVQPATSFAGHDSRRLHPLVPFVCHLCQPTCWQCLTNRMQTQHWTGAPVRPYRYSCIVLILLAYARFTRCR